VTACKAAAGSAMWRREYCPNHHVHRTRQVSTKGPGDEGDWTVFLLILHAEIRVSVDLETMNGPISLYDVDGKLTARAHNVRSALENFSGDAEITA